MKQAKTLSKKIVVMQFDNPKFNTEDPEANRRTGEEPYKYRVLSTVNTVDFAVDSWLDQNAMRQIIDEGLVAVEVKSSK